MSQNEPIVWTGPHPVDGGTRCQRWLLLVDRQTTTTLAVTYYPDDKPGSNYRYRVECGYNCPVATGAAESLADAKKAARDALIDFADALGEAGRRIVSTVKPPEDAA